MDTFQVRIILYEEGTHTILYGPYHMEGCRSKFHMIFFEQKLLQTIPPAILVLLKVVVIQCFWLRQRGALHMFHNH